MKLTWRDGVATILVATIVIPYVGYLIRGEMPFIDDTRDMAITAMILGLATFAVGGTAVRDFDLLVDTMAPILGALGSVALVLGIATLITTNELLLAGFIGAIVLLWVLTTIRHEIFGRVAPAAPDRPMLEAPVQPTARIPSSR